MSTFSLKVKQTKWDLSPLFKGDEDPAMVKARKAIEQKSHEFVNHWREREDYLSDPVILKKALDEYEFWQRNYGTDGAEGYYLWLRNSQSSNDPKVKAKVSQSMDFSNRILNQIQFFELRLSKIEGKYQKKFLSHPALRKYQHFLEKIFAQSSHLLTEPEEKILNLKAKTSHTLWVKMRSSFLAKEERSVTTEEGRKKRANFEEITGLLQSQKKSVRDQAAKAMNDILLNNVEVAEAEVNAILDNKKTDDELRNFSRPDSSRHLGDDIDTEVVDSVVKAVTDRFDISRDYYQLKSKLLGVRKLAYHERNVPYGKMSMKYTFQEAVDLVYKVCLGLDPEFANILEGYIKNGQIDVYPAKGKRSGAFCAYHLITLPTYMMLNHIDQLKDALVLAHELGHGINFDLIKQKQDALNFGTPMSTAEVASTFMEDFVLQEILQEADDEQKLSIMVQKLDDDIASIFRQVACYNLETDLHLNYRQKGYLSKDEIGQIFLKNMAAYMGRYVEMSSGSENWWVYWPHIRYFFYVYSYASGLLISKALQKSVKQDSGFITKVKEFLSAGFSDSPRNLFAKMGVDITDKKFWESGLREVELLLDETAALAKKLGKA